MPTEIGPKTEKMPTEIESKIENLPTEIGVKIEKMPTEIFKRRVFRYLSRKVDKKSFYLD